MSQNEITEEWVKSQGVRSLNSRLYLDPLARFLLARLRQDDERSGSDVMRRLIRAEAIRRGIYTPQPPEMPLPDD